MFGTNIAVSAFSQLTNRRRSLEHTRQNFLQHPQGHYAVRSVIYESWRRCLEAGVDPDRRQTEIPLQLKAINNLTSRTNFYARALPIVKDLAAQIEKTAHIVILSDAQGRIIFLEGDPDVKRHAEKIHLVLGANWNEGVIGTNAIGTSLAAGCSVQVFAAEHYCAGIHDWVCSSSPIRDPITKEILGVVDVTGLWKDAQPHSLGMTVMASNLIQNRLSEQKLLLRDHLLERYFSLLHRYPHNGLLMLDATLFPVEGNAIARKLLMGQIGEIWQTLKNKQELQQPIGNKEVEKSYEFFIDSLGIAITVQEIWQQSERIGYVLILKPGGENTSTVAVPEPGDWNGIIGKSSGVRSVMSKCNTVAHTDVPVLLFGESGSGKELFARAIHHNSPRHDKPFIALNCGAIPRELLASELFGYEAGTFTGANKSGKKGKFEEANGGTLFLDEIGEMPLEFQVHLLRVLQEREIVRLGSSKSLPVDVRIVTATHRNLSELVREGVFREDLYYRLHVVGIFIPPLRERREDIELLIDNFLAHYSKKYEKPYPTLDRKVKEFLVHVYTWPGNVRELEHTIEYAILFSQGSTITIEDLPTGMTQKLSFNSNIVHLKSNSARTTLAAADEKEFLLGLLREAEGNLSAVARQLGVARSTLYRQLNKWGIGKTKAFM